MIAIKKIVLPPKDTAELIEDGKSLNVIMMQIQSEIKLGEQESSFAGSYNQA